MQQNWEEMMEIAPIHGGSPEEEKAIQFMKKRLEEYGLKCHIHRFEAYLSHPEYSKLKITAPIELEIQSTPYRQVGSTSPDGFEEEMIYFSLDKIGYAECRDKIVLCEQKTSRARAQTYLNRLESILNEAGKDRIYASINLGATVLGVFLKMRCVPLFGRIRGKKALSGSMAFPISGIQRARPVVEKCNCTQLSNLFLRNLTLPT